MPAENVTGKTKTTLLGNLGAGLLAGIAESILIATPGETLKTKIIDDQAGQRVYRSASHAMVRFTSYRFFLEQMGAMFSRDNAGALQFMNTVAVGALAGVATAYTTMPFDTTKTRLQALDGHRRYHGSWDCLWSVVQGESVFALWQG